MDHTKTIEPAYLRDTFLSNYCFADVLFSPYCSTQEMRDIFNKYAQVFCIRNEAWVNEIWSIVSSELFALADNISDFNRLVRLAKQYPDRISKMENYVIAQKAAAVQIKSDILLANEDASFDSILHILERKANGGDTDCISLMGFLEYHGIFLNQNIEMAKKRFRAAASWDHLFSILMGVAYLREETFYQEKLFAVFHTRSSEDVLHYLQDDLKLPTDTKPDRIALALEHAFCQGSFQTCKLNQDIMKVMNSSVLSSSAKHKLIRSANGKENLSSELPLNVTSSTEIVPDLDIFRTTGERRSEFEQIRSNLSMVDLRSTASYRPLLIIGKDHLVLDFYRDAVRRCLSSSPITQLLLNEGEACNLSRSNDNILIAAMDKMQDRNTILFIEHCETLNKETAAELARYLKPATRKHHKSCGMTPVEIDLSGILPILLASSTPDALLMESCDVVFADELSQAEFNDVLNQILERKRKDFNLTSLSMEPAVPTFLFDYSAEAVMHLINKAIGQLRQSANEVYLTVSILQSIIDAQYTTTNKIGFWRNKAI